MSTRGPSLFDDPPRGGPAPGNGGGPARLRVSELTARIAAELGGLGRLCVEGEVSGLKRASSGHVYFDLKDSGARLACVVWASQVRRALAREPKEGDMVLATGRLDLYAPRGSYSLLVERLEPVGLGALLLQLEALKKELAARGWLARRRPLPPWPGVVGIATSRDGAALRDILRTRSQRWPAYPVRLCHAPVQGPGSARALAQAVRALWESGVDVVVVARGGGSAEDLLAFQDEELLRAIWECPVPVVSAVGHETDTTLSDLVADLRAHTPTDAAVRLFPDRREVLARVLRTSGYLLAAMESLVAVRSERLARAANAPVLRSADWMLGQRERELRHLGARLRAAIERRLEGASAQLATSERRLVRVSPMAKAEAGAFALERLGRRLLALIPKPIADRDRRLERAAAGLHALSPLSVLARGYTVTLDRDGRPIRDGNDVAPGDLLTTRLARGEVRSKVLSAEGAEPRRDASDP